MDHQELAVVEVREGPALFAPAASGAFGARVGASLGVSIGAHEERLFDRGECFLRPLNSMRGRSAYVIQSLFSDRLGSANDRLCALLFLIGALKDGGARHVTACVPYMAYARQDRHSEQGDPVTSRYVAQLFEAVGTDRVVALEIHNRAAFDNAFRCEAVHVDALTIFVTHFSAGAEGHDYTVVTPDIGGAKRARRFQEAFQSSIGRPVNFAFMDKERGHDSLSGTLFAGDVAGRRVIIVDDLVSTGATVTRAADACRRGGAVRIEVAATHASFAPDATRLFEAAGVESVVVTDSVAIGDDFQRYVGSRLTVLSVAATFADTIRQLEQRSGRPRTEAPG